ncbi:MAG: hypothetical protein DI622_00495 [Chryseobacterium sp.]|uniref:hypothetical protein n=1 Tax=Chryseobacterium sp. TaxID=1871047 RepID=UPI000DB3FBB0|nr:hypothetical protein [Chryseobacterium sp.]MPS63720.1 hypothetical protein [Chryseobacterium sp.]PZU26556.1 MAG: hypothetical protein DI622_00495 [Chryseobacterium sp.]
MKKIFYLLIISALFIQCGKHKEQVSENPSSVNNSSNSKNLNISVLIDLSDRIDPEKNSNPTMEYFQRDIEYIKAIDKGFLDHIKGKKVIQLDDQMQIFFNPEPSDPKMNELTKELKVSFDKNTTKDNISRVEKNYSSLPSQIYQSAIQDKQYVGSDIWEFFKNKVKDYCIKDNHRNVLFILTDGYIYHKDSKFSEGKKTSYLTPELVKSLKLTSSDFKTKIQDSSLGFIKANDDLENLEVIVLGINPAKGNPFEGDVIKEYWENWFKEMKIKNYQIKSADLPSNLEPIILKAISGK